MFIQDYSKEIVSILVPIVAATCNKIAKGKSRFLCAQRHDFTFFLREQKEPNGEIKTPAGTVHTMSYFVRNDGKNQISGIEVVWNWRPDAINIWPPRPFDESKDSDGRFSISLKNMSPGEDLLIELIAFGTVLPRMVSCRCDQSVARHVELNFFEKLPSWKLWGFRALAFLGLATFVYGALRLLQILLIEP